MSQRDLFTIKACPFKDVYMNSKMFNCSQLNYTLFVELPKDMACTLEPIELRETAVKDSEDIITSCNWICGRYWLDVKFDAMNKNPGYHLYRITFIDRISNLTSYLYFAYTVQADLPEKPYVYMDQNGECNCATYRS